MVFVVGFDIEPRVEAAADKIQNAIVSGISPAAAETRALFGHQG